MCCTATLKYTVPFKTVYQQQPPVTYPTSWPHVALPTWSSTEQVARPATKWFHPSHWRPLEACCRLRTWWCNNVTALAGYATVMTMATLPLKDTCSAWSELQSHSNGLGKSRGPEFQAKKKFFLNNFPATVKIWTSGYQTTITLYGRLVQVGGWNF